MMSPSLAHRRRVRRIILICIAFLLLPWLFVMKEPAANQQYDDQGDAGFLPIPLAQVITIPSSAPAELQYWPVSVTDVQQWIEAHYPGALAGLPQYRNVIVAAVAAAKKDNLNPLLLLGILASEQSFLSPNVAGGMAHATTFLANPWDYGVYAGSPFAFAIGPMQSAEGAAAIADEVAMAVLKHGWSWTTFELDLAQRYAQNWQPWVHITFSVWQQLATNSAIELSTFHRTMANVLAVPVAKVLLLKTLGTQIALKGAVVAMLAKLAQVGKLSISDIEATAEDAAQLVSEDGPAVLSFVETVGEDALNILNNVLEVAAA